MAKRNGWRGVEGAAKISKKFNIWTGLGAGALALLIPGPNVLLGTYAAWNGVTADGAAALEGYAKKRK